MVYECGSFIITFGEFSVNYCLQEYSKEGGT